MWRGSIHPGLLLHDEQKSATYPDRPQKHDSVPRHIVVHGLAGQAALADGLDETVDEVPRRLAEVPLDVADEAGAVVDDAEAARRVPDPVAVDDAPAGLVEVEVPQAVDGVGLVRARLELLQSLGRPALAFGPRVLLLLCV